MNALGYRKKFEEVISLIDKNKHPEAHRLAWLLPLWVYTQDKSAEAIADDFVQNVAFWHWYYRILPHRPDIETMRAIWDAMDEEDKI